MNDEERIKAKAKAVAEYFDSKSKKEETKRIEENFYENLKNGSSVDTRLPGTSSLL